MAREGIQFVIANGENASGGKGIDPRSAEELYESGVDVVTTGNHVWQNRDIIPYMRETDRLLRPLNFARDVPGLGWTVQTARRSDVRVGVLYLKHLLDAFKGDESLALAGWYQGERAVREHGVYPETRPFVANVLALRVRM